MWHDLLDFLLKTKALGLSHEAVIEIMVALLGVMMAALALIGLIVSLFFAVLGIFGYQTIKGEAKRTAKAIAEKVAAETASKTATYIAEQSMKEFSERTQAAGLSESQAENVSSPKQPKSTLEQTRPRKKATTDKGLDQDKEVS